MHDPQQAYRDDQHLQLLSIFHYVLAGLMALFGCFPLIHLSIGLFFLFAPQEMFPPAPNGEPDPPMWLFGLIFTIFPLIFILFHWTLALLTFLAGRRLRDRRSYTYCLVVAGICCIFFPFGTILGVFTIIVLVRPSVKALFEENAARMAKGL